MGVLVAMAAAVTRNSLDPGALKTIQPYLNEFPSVIAQIVMEYYLPLLVSPQVTLVKTKIWQTDPKFADFIPVDVLKPANQSSFVQLKQIRPGSDLAAVEKIFGMASSKVHDRIFALLEEPNASTPFKIEVFTFSTWKAVRQKSLGELFKMF
jgi:hypothetical protein